MPLSTIFQLYCGD